MPERSGVPDTRAQPWGLCSSHVGSVQRRGRGGTPWGCARWRPRQPPASGRLSSFCSSEKALRGAGPAEAMAGREGPQAPISVTKRRGWGQRPLQERVAGCETGPEFAEASGEVILCPPRGDTRYASPLKGSGPRGPPAPPHWTPASASLRGLALALARPLQSPSLWGLHVLVSNMGRPGRGDPAGCGEDGPPPVLGWVRVPSGRCSWGVEVSGRGTVG